MKTLKFIQGILTVIFFSYCVFGGLFFDIEITNIHVIIVLVMHIQLFNWDNFKNEE